MKQQIKAFKDKVYLSQYDLDKEVERLVQSAYSEGIAKGIEIQTERFESAISEVKEKTE